MSDEPPRPGSVETRRSWHTALLVLLILAISFGSPLLAVVGLRDIQASLHTGRSVVALASALVWIGTGVGGIPMGWLADRIGIRRMVAFGTLSIASGLALATLGSVWALYVGFGLLVGFLGNGAIYAPLLIYVSRWFDRRRGTAIALISSGQYCAGVTWPSLLETGMKQAGWQTVMIGYAAVVLTILPLTLLLRTPPEPVATAAGGSGTACGKVLGMNPNLAMWLMGLAGFCCCVPMALPSSHLVAMCGDLGISPSNGAAMLSVLLGCAFVSRQFWGAFADRFGGLRAVAAGSACQAIAIAAFAIFRDEAALFAIAAAYGLGFSGIIPSYSVAVRDLFPAREASWRIPTVLMTSMVGMAFGSWFGGAMFDVFLTYRPAFASGVVFNAANLALVGFLLTRQAARRRLAVA